MPKLLFFQVGRTFEEVARVRGDYDLWFRLGLGVPEEDFVVVRPVDGEQLPEHFEYSGIVVSGSAAMVTDRAPWSEATAAYLREAVTRELPVLGVCYGHQLLAHAFGGQVADNPRGRQVGTVEVELTAAAREDALFSVLPERLVVQASHRQSVLDLPASARLLASCAGDPHHAFRIGERAWGVQFHPEFDADVSRTYIEARRTVIADEGRDPEQLIERVRESDHGLLLLRRFAALIA